MEQLQKRIILMNTTSKIFKRRVNGSVAHLILSILALLIVFLGIMWLGASDNTTGLVIMAISVVVIAACLTVQVTLKVEATALTVSVLGRLFTELIPLGSIKDVSPGPSAGINEGVGVRLLNNATGYLVGGQSIQIDTKTQRILVSVRTPDEALQAIERVRNRPVTEK